MLSNAWNAAFKLRFNSLLDEHNFTGFQTEQRLGHSTLVRIVAALDSVALLQPRSFYTPGILTCRDEILHVVSKTHKTVRVPDNQFCIAGWKKQKFHNAVLHLHRDRTQKSPHSSQQSSVAEGWKHHVSTGKSQNIDTNLNIASSQLAGNMLHC